MARSISFLVGLALTCTALPAGAGETDEFALGTAFTYQGRLEQRGQPAQGRYDFSFDLYDAPEGGSFLGRNDLFDHPVIGGIFAAELDFGRDVASEEVTWLEVQIRPAGSDRYTTLRPRQRVAGTVATTCTVNSDVQINGDLTVGLGREVRIGNAVTGLRLDQNEISVSALGDPELLINASGGARQVGIGVAEAEAPLSVVGSPDVTPTSGGALVIGSKAGSNVAFDKNEIMARNGGSTATLYLNAEGGDVVVGGTLDVGLQIVSHFEVNEYVTVHCPPGKTVIGGSCDGLLDVAEGDGPIDGNTGWGCQFDDNDANDLGNGTYAVCAKLK